MGGCGSRVKTGPKKGRFKLRTCVKAARLLAKAREARFVPAGKAWAKRTFDTYPSAYANMAASKYCKDPNYAKKAKGKA
jgi:hypothetical protein